MESYSWSAPTGSGITFADGSLASTTFTAPAVDDTTTFTLTLTASDGTDSGSDSIDVTVRDTGSAFVTTWKTNSPGQNITIPGSGTYTIDWGDGTVDEDVNSHQTHEYEDAGTHTVSITGGLTSIRLGDYQGSAQSLQSIEQWGSIEWNSMANSFQLASNMVYNATDEPDLSGVDAMTDMFGKASSFDGNLSGWDVSGVTDMKGMFTSASAFNGDISGWDVSSVTNMNHMFLSASAFNGDLSGWNVSSVTDMSFMFLGASAFDQNLGNWYVVPAGTAYSTLEDTLDVTTISAQNSVLDGHSPEYGIGSGGDSDLFNMTGSTLAFKAAPPAGDYAVNVTASGNSVFEDGNNWRVLGVKAAGPNQPPTADAGADQGVNEGATVALDGSGSSDPDSDPLTYSWESDGTPQITLDGRAPTFIAPQVGAPGGTVTFTLTVSDGNGGTDTDTVVITVNDVAGPNQPPAADAGADQGVNEGATVALDGTGSSDPDSDSLTYSWESDGTPQITLNGRAPTFTAPPVGASGGTVTFTLTVSDGNGGTDTDTVVITVNDVAGPNQPPAADAGADQGVNEGATVALDGSDIHARLIRTATP